MTQQRNYCNRHSIRVFNFCLWVVLCFGYTGLLAQHNLITPTPPMGWNSWNVFGGNINEAKIKAIADAMVTTGMKEAGYQYIIIDDGWQQGKPNNKESLPGRDKGNRLLADPQKFPNGIKSLSAYIHSKGLKFGIYTSPGKTTCLGMTASGGYEATDIKTFVDWEVDFIKLDWCSGALTDYTVNTALWRKLLDECGRPIVLSINAGRSDDYAFHGSVANMWRTTTDIMNKWSYRPEEFRLFCSILDVLHEQVGFEQYKGNGIWNDMDMLEVGNPPLTYEQSKAHFSMWAIASAPLIAGNDLRNMPDQVIRILTNKEVISVNKDQSTVGGRVKTYDSGVELWVKRLKEQGQQAVALLNTSQVPVQMDLNFTELGINKKAFVRDLWQHKDIGIFENKYPVEIPAEGLVMLNVLSNEYLAPFYLGDKSFSDRDFSGKGKVFEAEDPNYCTFGGGMIQAKFQKFSGKGYIQGSSNIPDRNELSYPTLTITFRIMVDTPGRYKAEVRYKNSGQMDKNYKLNKSIEPGMLKFAPTQINEWRTAIKDIQLKKGMNWIVVKSENNQTDEIAVDYLRISK